MNSQYAIRNTGLPLPKQQGLSLIELMVAITISMLIILALTAVFVNFSRTNREMSKANAMIDNGRFAMQMLQNDIVHAGFWGAYAPDYDDLTETGTPADVPTAVPSACETFNPAETDPTQAGFWSDQEKKNLVGIPVQLYDSVPTDEDGNPCAVVANREANTDVLLVRHAATTETTGAALSFQSSQCEGETPSFVLDSESTSFTLKKMDCATVAPRREYVSNLYYVRNYANEPGDGIPTLVRSRFAENAGVYSQQDADPLIEGVEGFRIELGVDSLSETGAAVDYGSAVSWADSSTMTTATNRGDGAPDGAFVRCSPSCTVDQLMNVTAIKVYILARNLETTPGYEDNKTYELPGLTIDPAAGDAFKRHLFVTTVRLPNLVARRETP